MKRIGFLILAMMAFTGVFGDNALASVCNTLAECQAVRSQVYGPIQELQGEGTIGDFLRNTDESLRTRMRHIDASDECEWKGTRLPTARELIQDAISRNSGLVLLEEADYKAGNFPKGFTKEDFRLVVAHNPDRNLDRFYYSKNYQRPEGDHGNYWVWSSSTHPDIDVFALYFDGNFGFIDYHFREFRNSNGSARCSKKK